MPINHVFAFILTPIQEETKSIPIHLHFCDHGNFSPNMIDLTNCILKTLRELNVKVKFLSFDGDPKMTKLILTPAFDKIINPYLDSKY